MRTSTAISASPSVTSSIATPGSNGQNTAPGGVLSDGAIAGISVGGVCFLVLLLFAFWLRRNSQCKDKSPANDEICLKDSTTANLSSSEEFQSPPTISGHAQHSYSAGLITAGNGSLQYNGSHYWNINNNHGPRSDTEDVVQRA